MTLDPRPCPSCLTKVASPYAEPFYHTRLQDKLRADASMTTSLHALWEETSPDVNVRQRLYQALRQAIIRMVLAPGRALSEKEIADTFDVSRQPVREAFIRLSESGLLEVRPQRGTYVVRISEGAVMEARFVREAVEVVGAH